MSFGMMASSLTRPTSKAVASAPRPTSLKELRQFLGLTGHYRRFVHHYAHISEPLTRLTSPSAKFEWTDECEKAFLQALGNALISAPILAVAQPNLSFFLSTDASDVAIGAVLEQEQEGIRRVVAYASKKLFSIRTKL
jgi:hypothetical protein